ncbi:response regulator transcription factor [Glycomyces tenuis]|uniref:response regulator transcription factor n=1 Tax=Glycomyces tenuis TaxID=58116 RepID=UPI00041C4B75|nr:response regulator transcription factor [Glycomyces tenuis]
MKANRAALAPKTSAPVRNPAFLEHPRHPTGAAETHQTIAVAVASPETVTLSGLAAVIGEQDDFKVVHTECDIEVSLISLDERRPDVLVTESCFAGSCVLETIERATPPVPVVVFSHHRSTLVLRRALQCGVSGFVTREASAATLHEAIRRVASGSVYVDPTLGAELAEHHGLHGLTARELDVLHLVATGHTTAEIAASLYVGERTVEACRASLKQKLGLSTKAQIHAYARDKGMLADCSCVPVPNPR